MIGKRSPVLFLFGTIFITPVTSFASWLCDRTASCWLDLEPGEVIMNFPVELQPENFPVSVIVSDSKEFVAGQNFSVTLELPDRLKGSDLQFALEVSEGATFVNGGCDGRRISGYGDGSKQEIQLKISSDNDSVIDEIFVWAGWALEHEAVKVTPKVKLTRANKTIGNGEREGGISTSEKDGMKKHETGMESMDLKDIEQLSEEKIADIEKDLLANEERIAHNIEKLENERLKKIKKEDELESEDLEEDEITIAIEEDIEKHEDEVEDKILFETNEVVEKMENIVKNQKEFMQKRMDKRRHKKERREHQRRKTPEEAFKNNARMKDHFDRHKAQAMEEAKNMMKNKARHDIERPDRTKGAKIEYGNGRPFQKRINPEDKNNVNKEINGRVEVENPGRESRRIDEEESTFSMDTYPYALVFAVVVIAFGVHLSKGNSAHHRVE